MTQTGGHLCATLPMLGLALCTWPAPLLAVTPRKAVHAAATCYAAGDLLCVLERLGGLEPAADPGIAAEQHRLLAMAAAKLDRHALARRAFTAWIRLDPRHHRLPAVGIPEVVRRDWAAAWLELHRAALDLRPREPPAPAALPAPVTAGDLPSFPPPPRSDRDRAVGLRLDLFGLGIAELAGDGGAGLGAGLAVGLGGGGRLRFAITAQGATEVAGAEGGVAGGFGLRARYTLVRWGNQAIDGMLAGAALVVGGAEAMSTAGIEPGGRWSLSLTRGVRFFVDLGVWLPGLLPTLRLGVTMSPGGR